MKCISCSADVPPAWIFAINSGICPSCGGPLMDEASKLLLEELREAMKQMECTPEGLSGWILSNYNLEKIGSAEPTKFHTKKVSKPLKRSSNAEDASDDLEDLDNPNSGAAFLKRAGQDHLLNNKPSKVKEILNRVRKAQGSQNSETSDVDEDIITDEDSDEQQDAGINDIDSGVDYQSYSDIEVPPVVPNETAEQTIHRERMKRLMKQSALASGGKVGFIKRS